MDKKENQFRTLLFKNSKHYLLIIILNDSFSGKGANVNFKILGNRNLLLLPFTCVRLNAALRNSVPYI